MKLGIQPRLLVLAGTLTILLWIVLGLAWSAGQTARARLDSMFNRTLKARTLARDLSIDVQEARSALLGMLVTADATLKASREQDLHDNVDRINNGLRQLSAFNDNATLDADYETARKNWEAYSATLEREILPGIKADEKDKVVQLLEGTQRDRRLRFVEAIGRIADAYVADSQAQVTAATNEARSSETVYMVMAGVSVVVSLVVIWMIGRISRPIRSLATTASAIAVGEINQPVTHRSGDELGQLADAFRDLISYVSAFARVAERVGSGDLTADVVSRSDRDALAASFAKMVDSLRQMVGRTSAAVASITGSTTETLAGVRELATSASGQAAAVSETTSTVEELRQSSDEVAERAKTVSDLARQAASAAEAGQRTIDETVSGMRRITDRIGVIARAILALSEQTQAVGKITATVNDIAEQSKMLAFNAAIEAAKAGEFGKGFGVVANEIRSLAEQSKQATSQIADILNDIQKASNQSVMVTEEGTRESERGMTLANESGEKIRAISDAIRSTAQNAMQIESATLQQARGMDQIAQAMASISTTATQAQAAGAQMERAMQDLNTLADQLKASVAAYKLTN
ncbi:MAG: methyl-accepting chemotaxis protein [Planctomycetota bacterium]